MPILSDHTLNSYSYSCGRKAPTNRNPIGVFHNRNPSNLDSSDQRIRLFCDLESGL